MQKINYFLLIMILLVLLLDILQGDKVKTGPGVFSDLSEQAIVYHQGA